jgi:hypothetical protein
LCYWEHPDPNKYNRAGQEKFRGGPEKRLHQERIVSPPKEFTIGAAGVE